MRFPEFAMERMQSTWEHRVRFDLSESGVEPLTLGELTTDLGALERARLGYAEGTGREATRALVAAFHPGASAEHVLITTGTSEANFLVLATLVGPGDEVVVVLPNYMQVHGMARGLGATVREVWLREADGWRIDLNALRSAITDRTKLVCICNPNNPTGQVLDAADAREVARAAERHGAWLLADEAYRGAERVGPETATFWGATDRVIVTGGLSKAYGLPGLRIGWLVAPADRIAAAWAMKDYTTIAPATLSELLAETALAHRSRLIERTRRLLNERWPLLETWARAKRDALAWTAPVAGAICFFRYTYRFESSAFVDRLIRECGTMIVPGAHFLTDRHLRIGFGVSPDTLRGGLAAVDRLLETAAVA
ncbi:MAG TPA: aminotransferase class I/II-fold pyridoxal phosphate-dependent enzyme [Candidatus Limnocylindria bacterium]